MCLRFKRWALYVAICPLVCDPQLFPLHFQSSALRTPLTLINPAVSAFVYPILFLSSVCFILWSLVFVNKFQSRWKVQEQHKIMFADNFDLYLLFIKIIQELKVNVFYTLIPYSKLHWLAARKSLQINHFHKITTVSLIVCHIIWTDVCLLLSIDPSLKQCEQLEPVSHQRLPQASFYRPLSELFGEKIRIQ